MFRSAYLTTWGMESDRARDWREDAACAGADPAMFELYGKFMTPEQQAAIHLCTTVCPVRAQCYQDALDFQADGVIQAGLAWEAGVVVELRAQPVVRNANECEVCGKTFTSKHVDVRRCSPLCKSRAYEARRRERKAAADFARRGERLQSSAVA